MTKPSILFQYIGIIFLIINGITYALFLDTSESDIKGAVQIFGMIISLVGIILIVSGLLFPGKINGIILQSKI